MGKSFREKGEGFLLFLLFFSFYCFFQIKSIYGGDSGDFVTAAWVWGIPHPPGYPFYSLISSVLVHLIPFFTPAWRIGLISSFSSAMTLGVFYLLLKKMTFSHPERSWRNAGRPKDLHWNWPALFGTLTLAFLYPFWLYSELAEVFALNNLFVVLLVYLYFSFFGIANFSSRSKRRLKFAITFFFIIGLSLAHHHTIVLLFPAFAYLAFKNKKTLKFQKKQLIFYFLFFIFGFSFYLYPLLACRKTPLVCWDDPTNIKNLIRLITRADYGTFKSGINLGNAPILRLYSLASFFRLAVEDFSVFGIIVILLGLYWSYRKNKEVFKFLIITLLTCFFFIFYASFMLVNDFMVATFERFVIFPYLFMSLSLGLGAGFVFEQTGVLVKKFKLSLPSRKVALIGIRIIIFILPLSLFITSFKRISILKNDLTAENMAKDFLVSLPKNSLLIVSSDTTVFDVQYVRYVLGFRDDVILISYPHLPAPFYKKALRKHEPQLVLSDKIDHLQNLEEFVKANSQNYTIFIDTYTFEPEEDWLPYGLTWQYLLQEDQPATASVVGKNLEIWNEFNDPLSGSLKNFKNLFLTDVLRVYQNARIDFGEYLIQNDYLDEAEEFFKKAGELKPNIEEVYIGLGLVSLKKGECEKAKEMFLKTLEINEKSALALGYLRKNELECFNNEERAKEFENQCITVQEGRETSLEDLGK